MKKNNIIIGSLVLVLIYLIMTMPAPTLSRCRLCESIPYHAPCLLNLATGERGELAVYESDPFIPGKLSEVQQSGVLSLISICGYMGCIDKNNWVMHLTIPKKQNEYEEKYFCKSCRELIEPYPTLILGLF